MRRAGRSSSGWQRPQFGAWLVLVGTALAWSCGGTSRQRQGNAGGAGGSNAAAGTKTGGSAGSDAGGKLGVAGSDAGTGRGGDDAGGGAEPIGEGGAGGSSAGGVSTGGVGAGGAPDPLLGFDCGDVVCAIGQACIFCQVEGMSERLCVPHPIGDPTGYAAATEPCDPPPNGIFNDCDGPEDCGAEQYCVAREAADGFTRCRDMPSSNRWCCFACDAPTDCTICRSAEDCPEGEACSPVDAADVMGCH